MPISLVEGRWGPRHRSFRGDGAVAADVIVHGEGCAADLDGCPLGPLALRGDELELVGLLGQLNHSLVLGDLAAHEALAFLDNALHALFELAQQLGGDRVDIAEVVVEAVGDERADAEVDVGEDVLNGLREHVRSTVAQDVQAILAGQVMASTVVPPQRGSRGHAACRQP